MPVCCTNAAARGPKIFRKGTSASLCGLWSTLNGKVIQLTGKKPAEAIKEKAIYSKPVTPYHRRVEPRENGSPQRRLCYLCQPSELEGGRKRATDPIWSLKLYHIEETITKPNELILYYLHDGPKRGFVPEELLIVPDDTELPSFS